MSNILKRATDEETLQSSHHAKSYSDAHATMKLIKTKSTTPNASTNDKERARSASFRHVREQMTSN